MVRSWMLMVYTQEKICVFPGRKIVCYNQAHILKQHFNVYVYLRYITIFPEVCQKLKCEFHKLNE